MLQPADLLHKPLNLGSKVAVPPPAALLGRQRRGGCLPRLGLSRRLQVLLLLLHLLLLLLGELCLAPLHLLLQAGNLFLLVPQLQARMTRRQRATVRGTREGCCLRSSREPVGPLMQG